MSSLAEVIEDRDRLARQLDEARNREQQLHMALDALPVLVSIIDIEERYRFANKAYEEWFGIPKEDLIGKTLKEVVGESAHILLNQYIQRGLSGEKFTFEQRNVPYRRGGTRSIRASYTPRLDASGRVDGFVALLTDVTEQRQAEEVLRQRSELEQQLIGIVSHDLRNPVSAIVISAATLLRRTDLDDRVRKPVGRILSSAERAGRMIRDLLDFTLTRLGGGLPIQRRETDLHELTQQVVEEAQIASPERTFALTHEGDGRGNWDADRMAQALSNLIGNAVTYGDPQAVIEVATAGKGDTLVLTVKNQGPPIPAELQPKLFQPMQRGAVSAGAEGRNVGLGLYIVKQILDAHGGTIDVASTREHGTVFTLRLPRRG